MFRTWDFGKVQRKVQPLIVSYMHIRNAYLLDGGPPASKPKTAEMKQRAMRCSRPSKIWHVRQVSRLPVGQNVRKIINAFSCCLVRRTVAPVTSPCSHTTPKVGGTVTRSRTKRKSSRKPDEGEQFMSLEAYKLLQRTVVPIHSNSPHRRSRSNASCADCAASSGLLWLRRRLATACNGSGPP